MSAVLVDTGFLVSLFRPADRLRQKARQWLQSNRRGLVTIGPIVVETCFFLDSRGKLKLLEWVQRGGISVTEISAASYPEIGTLIRKYADRDIDFADASLVWLASRTGLREILTVDESDFLVYRVKGGKRFELTKWRN